MGPRSTMTFKKGAVRLTILILTIVGITFLGYCYLESRWIKLKKIEIDSSDIPDSFNEKKLVFIADIHHGPFFSIDRVLKLVNRINLMQPDIVLMGGDYVHRDPKYIKPVFDVLGKLNTKAGIYAVLGNHDYLENAELTKKMMISNGINVCENKSYWVKIEKDSLKIGGIGDLWRGTQTIDSTIKDLKKTNFCVLISHNPDCLETIQTDIIDLALSGHTHGGQMTFFGIWAPLLPTRFGEKYRYGLKSIGKMKAYITSGVGTVTPPMRFFCRPEIVLITLRKEKTSYNQSK
jgi:uncharacterized protein